MIWITLFRMDLTCFGILACQQQRSNCSSPGMLWRSSLTTTDLTDEHFILDDFHIIKAIADSAFVICLKSIIASVYRHTYTFCPFFHILSKFYFAQSTQPSFPVAVRTDYLPQLNCCRLCLNLIQPVMFKYLHLSLWLYKFLYHTLLCKTTYKPKTYYENYLSPLEKRQK